LADLS